MTSPTRRSLTALALTMLVAAAPAGAQSTDAAADQLLDEVVEAYQTADRYHAEVGVEIRHEAGRWTETTTTQYRLAWQDQPQRLVLDHPVFDLQLARGEALLMSPDIPGRHLQMPVRTPTRFDTLRQDLPMVGMLPLPDLMLLMADDPVRALLNGSVAQVTQVPPADSGDKRLSLSAGSLEVVMTIDPATHLLRELTITQQAPASGPMPAQKQVQTYRFHDAAFGRTPPASLEALAAPSASQVATSLQEYLTNTGERGPHPLIGEAAPAFTAHLLDGGQVRLEDIEADVVVLDFWTTWCGPCAMSLPELQELADRMKQQGKSVAFYAVNVGETTREARDYWQQMGLTMPVLMDPQKYIDTAFDVPGYPSTYILADGKVQQVHTGYRPGYTQQIEQEIADLLQP